MAEPVGSYGVTASAASPAERVASGRRLVGSFDQIAGTRLVRVEDGPADGTRILEAWNADGLRIDIAVDRAFDIYQATVRGIGVAWLAPQGMQNRLSFESSGEGWLRNFHGGLFVTCGLDNVGDAIRRPVPEYKSPITELQFNRHGRMSNAAARIVRTELVLEGDDAGIRLEAEIRQGSLHLESLVMRRRIFIPLFGTRIEIADTVTNAGAVAAPVALLYHINLGHPFVNPGGALTIPMPEGQPDHVHTLQVPEPTVQQTVRVFEPQPSDSGWVHLNYSESGRQRATVSYLSKWMPTLLLWELSRERSFVLGPAPTTRSDDIDVVLEPDESLSTGLTFDFVG
ncbi:MAG: DUF4432 family protein [Actinomycetota bacterium]|nr:DUF4432 family protein [Actinomycetota bacterium]